MYHAWVTVSVADLNTEPHFLAERASQLLFSEVVEVHEEKDGYCRVRQADGYQGWVNINHISTLKNELSKHRSAKSVMVVAKEAIPKDPKTHKTVLPLLIYYGTIVQLERKSGDKVRIVLPDATVIEVNARAVEIVKRLKNATALRKQVCREAKRFLGVPYLWGGVTATGFDCSGLVQTVYKRCGVELPRDTKDQMKIGTEIKREDVVAGDLLFFKRHVGIVLAPDCIVHASLGGGGVRINDLKPNGAYSYRADLDRDFQIASRVIV